MQFGTKRFRTLGHGAGADVRRHAAAGLLRGVVAGVDFDLVAGEVAQAGDDRGLLVRDKDHRLGALKVLLVLVVRDARAPDEAGGGGEEGVRSVGDAHHGAPLPGAPGRELKLLSNVQENNLTTRQDTHLISKTSL